MIVIIAITHVLYLQLGFKFRKYFLFHPMHTVNIWLVCMIYTIRAWNKIKNKIKKVTAWPVIKLSIKISRSPTHTHRPSSVRLLNVTVWKTRRTQTNTGIIVNAVHLTSELTETNPSNKYLSITQRSFCFLNTMRTIITLTSHWSFTDVLFTLFSEKSHAEGSEGGRTDDRH